MNILRTRLSDLASTRSVLVAFAAGIVAYTLVENGVRLPVAGTVLYTDPRELFMTVGAALTGPVGATILALFLGAARSVAEGIPYRILAYLVGGIGISIIYRFVARWSSSAWISLAWLAIVPLYYAVSLVVALGVPYFVDRPAYAMMIGGDWPLLDSLAFVGSAIRFEMLFTTVVTTVIWTALPQRHRRPMWGPPAAPTAPVALSPLASRMRSVFAGRYLGLRLSLWFLLLSVIPFFGVVLTVQNETRESFESIDGQQRRRQAQMIAGFIGGSDLSEMKVLLARFRTTSQAGCDVADTSGRYVVHTDTARHGGQLTDDFDARQIAIMKSQGSGVVKLRSTEALHGYSWTMDGRYLVIAEVSPRMVAPTSDRLLSTIQERLALGLAFIALSIGLVIWFVVARPLRTLTTAVQSFDRAHLSVSVPVDRMDDEVRMLGEAFNSMTTELRSAYRGLEEEIAERIAATEEVRKHRTQLAEAMRIARMGSFEVDLRWFTMILSEEAYNLIGSVPGFRPNVPIPLRTFLPAVLEPEDLPRLEQALARVVDSTIVVPPREEEYRFRRSDASRTWVSLNYSVLWDAGRPAKIVGTMQDITVRKRAELESESAKRKFQAVVENNLDAIVLVDRAGTVQYGSPSLEDILGRAPSSWEGGSIFSVIHEEDLPMVRLAFEDIRDRDGASARKTYRVRHGNGSWVWVETIAKNALNDPAVRAMVVNLRDITERKHAEEELLRLRQAVETSNEVVFMTDPDGIFRYVNRAFSLQYGYTAEEVVGKMTPRILKSGMMDQKAYQKFWNSIRTDEGFQTEIINRRKDGSLVLVEATANGIRDLQGRIVGFLAIQRDITERKKAEEALRHSEANLRVAQRIGKIGSWEVDIVHRQTTWSPETYRILGRQPETFVVERDSFLNAIHPDDVPQMREALVATVTRGLSLRGTHRIVLPDGSMKHVETIGEVEFGADGQPVRVVGSIQDVTDSKLFEEALSDKVRRLQLLRELGLLFARSLERPEIVDTVSRFIPQYLGVTRALIRFVDTGSDALVSASDSAGETDRPDRHLQPSGYSISGRCLQENRPILVNDCRSTDLIPAEWIEHFHLRSVLAVPIRTTAGVIGVLRVDDSEQYLRFTDADVEFVSIVADQLAVALENARLYAAAKQAEEETERLNAELEQRVKDRTAQLEAVNQELESFSYSVSHDLRAPLRHISGFVELLRDRTNGMIDDESLRYLATVSQSAVRLGNLIDELLAFSRIGRTDLRKGSVDLARLVAEVRRDMDDETRGRVVTWTVGELPPVQGDANLLKLVISNLLSNAVKFSRGRPVAKIDVGALPRNGASGLVTFFVRDNGAGFDQAYAGKLFGVFQRLHGAEEFEGTGIGLANVRRIVQRHGGLTWAEGSVDRGATIFFSLPGAEET